MWIYRYTLALCKEIEGQIRATFQNTAVGAVVVNGSELLTDARTEKADLLAELKEMLNEVSRRSQLEKKQAESEFTRQTMNQIPLLIYSL
jgi:antitoxin component of MazEF toxin-antitoxin module